MNVIMVLLLLFSSFLGKNVRGNKEGGGSVGVKVIGLGGKEGGREGVRKGGRE